MLKFPDSELLDEEEGGEATPTPGGDGVIIKEDVIAEWGADPQDVLVQSRNQQNLDNDVSHRSGRTRMTVKPDDD